MALVKYKIQKRICDTVINFANLPLKTNFYNRKAFSKQNLLNKTDLWTSKINIQEIVTNLLPGGGGEECETIVTPSFKKDADPDPLYTDPDSDSMQIRTHYTRIRIRIQKISYLFPPLIL